MKKTIWIDAPVAVVHTYFVDEAKVTEWSGVAARLDPRPGGIYELDMGQGGVIVGRFIEVASDRVVYEIDSPGDHPPSRVEVRLHAEAGGTRVEVDHSGLPVPFGKIASRGWDHHLARLSVRCTGGAPGPDGLCQRSMESLLD